MNTRKKFKDYLQRYGAISMLDFLSDYVGIEQQHLKLLKNATHRDIKLFNFDYVVSVSFDMIDHDKLATGGILLVVDKYNHIGAYLNPLRLQSRTKSLKKIEKI